MNIIFDLDDTLVPSSRIYDLALLAIGIDPKGPSFLQSRAQIKKNLPPGHTSARNRLLYLKAYLENEKKFSAGKLLSLIGGYESELEKQFRAFWQSSGRHELLKILKSKARLSLLTNENTRTQMLKLRAIDPEGELFDLVVTSEEVGTEKPGARIFDEVLMRLGNPPAPTIVFVGDNFENDIAPASKRGWRGILTMEFLSEDQRKVHQGFHDKIDRIEDMPYKLSYE
jgi:HAD superfamily hydrolase (TIGR01549 family)